MIQKDNNPPHSTITIVPCHQSPHQITASNHHKQMANANTIFPEYSGYTHSNDTLLQTADAMVTANIGGSDPIPPQYANQLKAGMHRYLNKTKIGLPELAQLPIESFENHQFVQRSDGKPLTRNTNPDIMFQYYMKCGVQKLCEILSTRRRIPELQNRREANELWLSMSQSDRIACLDLLCSLNAVTLSQIRGVSSRYICESHNIKKKHDHYVALSKLGFAPNFDHNEHLDLNNLMNQNVGANSIHFEVVGPLCKLMIDIMKEKLASTSSANAMPRVNPAVQCPDADVENIPRKRKKNAKSKAAQKRQKELKMTRKMLAKNFDCIDTHLADIPERVKKICDLIAVCVQKFKHVTKVEPRVLRKIDPNSAFIHDRSLRTKAYNNGISTICAKLIDLAGQTNALIVFTASNIDHVYSAQKCSSWFSPSMQDYAMENALNMHDDFLAAMAIAKEEHVPNTGANARLMRSNQQKDAELAAQNQEIASLRAQLAAQNQSIN